MRAIDLVSLDSPSQTHSLEQTIENFKRGEILKTLLLLAGSSFVALIVAWILNDPIHASKAWVSMAVFSVGIFIHLLRKDHFIKHYLTFGAIALLIVFTFTLGNDVMVLVYFLPLVPWINFIFTDGQVKRNYYLLLFFSMVTAIYIKVGLYDYIPISNFFTYYHLVLAGVIQILIFRVSMREKDLSEEVLKENEARFRLMAKNAKDLVCLHFPDGSYMYVSPSVRDLTGYAEEELLGKDRYEFYHPEDRQKFLRPAPKKENVNGSLVNGIYPEIYRFKLKSGEYRWFETITNALRNEKNEVVQYLTSTRDISDRVKVEQRLSEKVEELNQQKAILKKYIDSNMQLENFAYIASHDLRHPLLTTIGFAKLLKNRYQDGLDDQGKILLDHILRSTENMNELIKNLLIYSRVEAKHDQIAPILVEGLLEDLLNENQQLIRNSGAAVEWGNMPKEIFGNAINLKQLFQNLLINAIKFKKPNEVPFIFITGSDIGSHWKFQVKDNGIGIDPRHHEKIFLLFKRLHNRKDYDGFGLGLSICKKIVEKHGGEIWVESQPGEGATFHFTLSKEQKMKSYGS